MPRSESPHLLTLAAGDYHWCACGQSRTAPFCSPADCAGTPVRFCVRRDGARVWLCGCGRTRDAPFCDGSHNKA